MRGSNRVFPFHQPVLPLVFCFLAASCLETFMEHCAQLAVAVGIYKPYREALARKGAEWCSQSTPRHQDLTVIAGRWFLGIIWHKFTIRDVFSSALPPTHWLHKRWVEAVHHRAGWYVPQPFSMGPRGWGGDRWEGPHPPCSIRVIFLAAPTGALGWYVQVTREMVRVGSVWWWTHQPV